MKTTTNSRAETSGKSGSTEHLSALIDLCLLIERHKQLILLPAEPGRTAESIENIVRLDMGRARVPKRANRVCRRAA
jgi:hypothetical protein